MPAPSVQSIVRTGLRYYFGETQFRDFSGGWNIRDAATELAINESPDLFNVTLDERGGVSARLGYAKDNPTPYTTALVNNVYYWAAGTNKIVQCGADLYKDNSTVSLKTFSTAARVGFADFTGLLYIIHPVDGLFSYNGTTVSAVAAGPKGTIIYPWQNKLFASGDPNAKSRVYFSAAGDGATWPGTAFNDLREKDNEAIVAFGGAAGIDVAGRPGLLAYKRRSTYRIFDSTTGSYQTIDAQVGAAGPLAVTNNFERTLAISEQGIFWTDGVGPQRPASEKIKPVFNPAYSDFSSLDKWCAGTQGDRCYFSLERVGASANDLELEYHPIQGWFTANSCAASCYATYGLNTQKLVAGSPSVNGQTYQRLVTGADDGVAITSRFQTHWIEPTRGHPVRILRFRITGRGILAVNTIPDYQLAPNNAYSLNLAGTAAIWDDPGFVWDTTALWGPTAYKYTQDIHANVVVKAVSLQFVATTSNSSSALPILGTGSAPEIGSWGLYGVDISFAPLGLS